MARKAHKVDLAAWLCSYNPLGTLDHFQQLLDRNDVLSVALNSIRVQASRHGDDNAEELTGARQKVDTLRNSLGHLTAHLSSLTDRLASSQSSLAALELSHARSSASHAQELLALQALKANAELAKEKKDALRKLAEKDEEIARLAADQASRRSEAQKLFDSLDTLLSLGGVPSLAQTVPLPPAAADEAEQLSCPPIPRPSVLDHPSLAAAAAHSYSRQHAQDQSRATFSTEEEGRRRETLGLEDEVRELENEIARLNASGANQSHQPNLSTLAEADPAADRQSLLLTIEELNAQVERLQVELREAKHERGALRRVVDEHQQHRSGAQPCSSPDESLLAKVEELETERDRLAQLLHLSETECASLSHQLSATHSSIDALSLRIRRKLEEQKHKLEVAYAEVERGRDDAEEWARRARGAEGEVRRLRGRLEESERRRGGGRSGGGSGDSID
ncbi:hypothetical protein JCM6882_007799 [Rhodosporidiobolus microsporus]